MALLSLIRSVLQLMKLKIND